MPAVFLNELSVYLYEMNASRHT